MSGQRRARPDTQSPQRRTGRVRLIRSSPRRSDPHTTPTADTSKQLMPATGMAPLDCDGDTTGLRVGRCPAHSTMGAGAGKARFLNPTCTRQPGILPGVPSPRQADPVAPRSYDVLCVVAWVEADGGPRLGRAEVLPCIYDLRRASNVMPDLTAAGCLKIKGFRRHRRPSSRVCLSLMAVEPSIQGQTKQGSTRTKKTSVCGPASQNPDGGNGSIDEATVTRAALMINYDGGGIGRQHNVFCFVCKAPHPSPRHLRIPPAACRRL
ncbi:hypothetical protein F4809DRAFT_639468 [Biscogniauxia mediterranea]|nr:hypothetical protein F4809DRAFT_639468 [Biscogniauxia mediterranea]